MWRQFGYNEQLIPGQLPSIQPLFKHLPDRLLVEIYRGSINMAITGFQCFVECFLDLFVRCLPN